MSWCVITVRTMPHPRLRAGTLCLDVESVMEEEFVRFLRQLPWETRGYDPETRHWWVHDQHRQTLCAAARASYDEVLLVEGRLTTDLVSGRVTEQLGLFDEESPP